MPQPPTATPAATRQALATVVFQLRPPFVSCCGGSGGDIQHGVAAVQRLPGVASVRLDADHMAVRFDPRLVGEDAITRTLKLASGYDAQPAP
jgi:hypothetical protein